LSPTTSSVEQEILSAEIDAHTLVARRGGGGGGHAASRRGLPPGPAASWHGLLQRTSVFS
jgi:hypothetical protein